MIHFGRDTLLDIDRSSHLEWLVSNGLGGYASSTITGLNTRRYHGLLIAALNPPTARTLLLQKIEETLEGRDGEFHLSTNAYPGTLHPTGYRYLEEFRLDPFPVFRFKVPGAVLEKEVCLVHAENMVIVQYRLLEAAEPCQLVLNLLVNYRSHHSLTHEDPSLSFRLDSAEKRIKIVARADATPFYIYCDKGEFSRTDYWYRNFLYGEDRDRGYEFNEDAYNPGQFSVSLHEGESVNVAGAAHEPSIANLERTISAQRDHVKTLVRGVEDNFLRDLFVASMPFIVRKGQGASCIAGYHWFTDWGRDAMISLPGLTLVTGRFRQARMLLTTFAKNMKDGLIPNYFSETDGSRQFNSLDATMWFFHACKKYFQYTKDTAIIKALYPALRSSIESLLRGTMFEIGTDSDLLLNIGASDVQLTWMDAKVKGLPVTPRNGKPVEINALWHCALDTMSGFAKLIGDEEDRDKFSRLANQVRANFAKAFWNAAENCLYDRVSAEGTDSSIRPNQIIAVHLPKEILEPTQEKAVVETVRRELLTPFGLRTLSPRDRNYEGRYEGDPVKRDLAYHQGSAWPWLLGPFIKAYIRVSPDMNRARAEAVQFLQPIRLHLSDAGLGYISELFDGDPPQQPRGCIAQAWSVAEVLRAYFEDILGKEPKDPLA